jgi:hypothetical protein
MLSCTPYPLTCGSGWDHHGWHGPFGGIVGLGALVLWIWMLVDVLTKEADDNNQRLIWGLVVGFTYVVGAILYLVIRRPERVKTLGR